MRSVTPERLTILRTAALVCLVLSPAPLAAQARPSGPSRVPTPAEQLTLARLLRMADARAFDGPLVRTALASSAAPVRRFAAGVLGQLGAAHGDSVRPLLRALLNDPDTVVAARSAFGLGLLRDSVAVARLASVARTGTGAFAEAAWSLGEIGPAAREAIGSLLGERALPDDAVVQLLVASARTAPLPGTLVARWLRSPNRAIVWAAAYAIARSNAAAGVRALLGVPAEQPPLTLRRNFSSAPYVNAERAGASVDGELARGLAKRLAGDSLADRATARLLDLVRSPEPHVRINAARSLGSYMIVSPVLVSLAAADPDANVRVAAAQSLAGAAYQDTVWARLLAGDTSFAFRSALLEAAARTGQLRGTLEQWRRAPQWRMRAAAYGAAASMPDSGSVRRFSRAGLTDSDARAREVALATFVGLDTTLGDTATRQAVTRALRDPDPVVRATALSALAVRADARSVVTALDAYALARSDVLADARLASLALVAAAWRRDSASFAPRVVASLRALPPDTAHVARLAARSVTPLGHWRSAPQQTRPLHWYASVVRDHMIPALAGRADIARIRTSQGIITIALAGADAPLTVHNFETLARAGFYRGTRFHRVVPNFVAQDGDPRGDGNGGPSYAIRDELNTLRYERGAVGMALSGPDTGGSQYFLTLSPQPHLDGRYTIFGQVIGGLEVMDRLIQGDAIQSVTVQ